MEQQLRIARQLVELQRVFFDCAFSNLIVLWDRAEKSFGPIADGSQPPQGKTVFKEWVGLNRKACQTMKNSANEGFAMVVGLLAGGAKQQNKTKSP